MNNVGDAKYTLLVSYSEYVRTRNAHSSSASARKRRYSGVNNFWSYRMPLLPCAPVRAAEKKSETRSPYCLYRLDVSSKKKEGKMKRAGACADEPGPKFIAPSFLPPTIMQKRKLRTRFSAAADAACTRLHIMHTGRQHQPTRQRDSRKMWQGRLYFSAGSAHLKGTCASPDVKTNNTALTREIASLGCMLIVESNTPEYSRVHII